MQLTPTEYLTKVIRRSICAAMTETVMIANRLQFPPEHLEAMVMQEVRSYFPVDSEGKSQ